MWCETAARGCVAAVERSASAAMECAGATLWVGIAAPRESEVDDIDEGKREVAVVRFVFAFIFAITVEVVVGIEGASR